MNALLGVLFIVVGIGTIVVMLWRWRTGADEKAAPTATSGEGGP
jgi:hypothetical protein